MEGPRSKMPPLRIVRSARPLGNSSACSEVSAKKQRKRHVLEIARRRPCWTAGSLSAGSFNRDSDLPCAEYLRCMSHQHCPFCARSCAHAGCSCQNEGAPHAHMSAGGDARARTRGVLVRRVTEWGATWAETFSRCRPNPRHRHHLLPTMELQVFLVRCSTGRQRLRN